MGKIGFACKWIDHPNQVDIMCESKGKNLASRALHEQLRQLQSPIIGTV